MEASGWALGLLRPLLLLLLLLFPGAEGQSQVCSVDRTRAEVTENELPTNPLARITAPPGQTVVVSNLSIPADIFYIMNGELRLNQAPDYETHPVLTANLECKTGSTVVTRLLVVVEVLNVNDMTPSFPFINKAWNISEDTNVGTTVIPATELTATDEDGDLLFYSLEGQSPVDAHQVFSLAGVNFPALQLAQALDYEKNPTLVLRLLARDTPTTTEQPSHTATATITIQVIPADMRPPWFLPCLYTDGRVCIHAQYRGAVPTGSVLTSPLTFEPGPVYAIDGDTVINEQIRYSIIAGNTDDTFLIGEDSGNITMAKAVPVAKTFNLMVRAQQQVHTGSYSVTQVTIQAEAGQLYPPRFPQALYRGWLPPGTGINVAVRDAEDPEKYLRLRAEDDDFPAGVPNSALQYRITNSSAFRMSGEIVRTNDTVGAPQVLYLEAEVLDMLTSEKDTTTIEILIQETEPTPPPAIDGTTSVPLLLSTTSSLWTPSPSSSGSSLESTTLGSGTQTSPTSKNTPTRSPTQDSPKPPGPGPTLVPTPPGTTVKPSAVPPTQRPPGPTLVPPPTGTSSTQGPPGPGPTLVPPPSGTTVKPSAIPPTQYPPGPPGPGPSGGSQTGAPGGTTGETSTNPGGSSGGQEQQMFTMNEMAVMGGVLGALLFLTLVLLGVFIYKHYGGQMKCGVSSKHGNDLNDSGYDNKTFQAQESSNWVPFPSPSPEPEPLPQSPKDDPPGRPSNGSAPQTPEVKMPSPAVREAEEEEKEEAKGEGSRGTSREGPVRSILTKERKSEDGGYKAVWFGEDIGAQVDVVVINSPVLEEPVVVPDVPEEDLDAAPEESEFVLVVSEEPEVLLTTAPPRPLSVVLEVLEPVVVHKEEPEGPPKEPAVEPEEPPKEPVEEPEEPPKEPAVEPEEPPMGPMVEPMVEPMEPPKEPPKEPPEEPKVDQSNVEENETRDREMEAPLTPAEDKAAPEADSPP
ncbi:cadherin-related family member 5 isoform X1 [Dromiciops gliroides]|uniref:cadherin-related family member 5 isoform X1 n=1 Tax=Dromiciops gliroides TaxID=33562 RepID=UPI001CC75559|nr:cadherin-related family member 5 isoform X1 [Dromiciops gliroides]